MNRVAIMFGLCVAVSVCGSGVAAQQVPDKSFAYVVKEPAYPSGTGPRVCVDEGHKNFHTLDGRFWAFGELLRRDGYVVRAISNRFTVSSLGQCAIVVVSNAQPSDEPWEEYRYPTPSAFAADEVDATRRWVRDGGNLLLIADHMPLAGAAATLAAAFDISFTDGFAVEDFVEDADRAAALSKPTLFQLADRTLLPHSIVRGRHPNESVNVIRSFTGQAFRASADAQPLLVLPSNFVSFMPRVAWEFAADTRKINVGGWLQGAVLRFGAGRAAFFGEAAMFSAQVSGPDRRPMGLNAPGAEQNAQFVLNVMHWLSGLVE